MKLLIITDLHFWANDEYKITEELDEYDICFLLGDIQSEYLKELKQIIKTPMYGLNGNHDSKTIEGAEIGNLHGRCGRKNDCVFCGLQGSVRYKSGPWTMYTQEESREICKALPPCDVFLTHDKAFDVGESDPAHCGLQGILEYIEEHQPKLHIHGHLHENTQKKIGNTLSIGVYKAAIVDTDTLEVNILY